MAYPGLRSLPVRFEQVPLHEHAPGVLQFEEVFTLQAPVRQEAGLVT